MSFTVQRLPPGLDIRRTRRVLREALLKSMPFTVEVEPEPRTIGYGSPCKCTTVYRITDLDWLRKRELVRRSAASAYVCDCMGVTSSVVELEPEAHSPRGR